MKLLGRGGYAEVYLAENKYLGVETAIKVLKLRDLDTLEQERFRSEAKFMTTLEHPHIIKVLDYGIEMSQRGSGIDGSTPYLVMEYARHGTLRHLYPHGTPMPLLKVASYTKQVAEALQYAHDKNIIHLDVKPENMLVRKADDIALSDFGIAVAGLNTSNLQEQQVEILQKMARGEQIAIPGTAQYLAPERLHGHKQRASDQYSLAVVVYEWLCGRRPFEGSDLEICQKHVQEDPPPLSTINPAITRDVEQVVMKGLAKQPADRYRTVRDFALALEKALQAALKPAAPKVTPTLPPIISALPLLNPTPATPSTPPRRSPGAPQPVAHTNSSNPGYRAQPGPQPFAPVGNQGQQQIHLPDPNATRPGTNYAYDATIGNIAPGTLAGVNAQPRDGLAGVVDEISRSANEPISRTREIFVSDRYFRKTKRTRRFLLLGIPANILAALIVLVSDPFPTSLLSAVLVGGIAVFMLWRCTVTVKRSIALTFGAAVAICWGHVAASVAGHIPNQSLALPGFLLAFAISLCIHFWYVSNRLKN